MIDNLRVQGGATGSSLTTDPASSGTTQSGSNVGDSYDGAPQILGGATVTGRRGQAFSYQVSVQRAQQTGGAFGPGNGNVTYRVTGLPGGLTINSSTGLISGTPNGSGTSTATVSVSDYAGGTSLNVVFVIE